MKPPRPTDAELDILHLLWELGPATVRQVHERLAATKPSQYTTTLKLMQIMADKGLLERDESARSHVYRAALEREQVQQQVAGYLLDRVFGGSARSLLMGALAARKASPEELDSLRRMLQDYEKGPKKGASR
jgi:predicted transcriptional regulator